MAKYHSEWYARNRERLLPIRRAYNEKYFADPANAERRRQAALKPEQRALRKQYKKTDAGRAAEKRYQQSEGNKQRLQRNRLKSRYGLTVDDVAAMKLAQFNRCAICPRDISNKHHIDHDHASGKVRGLLCTSCNMGLGLFKDDVNLMQAAIAYLCNTKKPQP